MSKYLKERYPFDGLHYAATMLDPRYKSLAFLEPAERQNVVGEAMAFTRKMSPEAQASAPVEATSTPPPKKLRPTAFEEFVTQVELASPLLV